MQSVSICISPGRKFEEAFVKRWRKERRTLLHFFVVYDLKGGCFDLFRVEDSKIQTKSESFSLNISLWDISAFPFLAGILASSIFFGSSKVSMLSEIFGKNIRKKFPGNRNTNIIRFEKITRIRIRIIFGFKKSPEYEYEY